MAEQTEDKAAKTEEPTPRKLRQAREKGDVPQSRETGTMMMILSLLMFRGEGEQFMYFQF